MAKIYKPVKKVTQASKSVAVQKEMQKSRDKAKEFSRVINQKRKESKSSVDYDPSKVGFGRHDYHFIDPDAIDLNIGPGEGQMNFEDKYALNFKSPENELTLQILCTLGAQFETSAEGFEGIYEVEGLPKIIDGSPFAQLKKVSTGESLLISLVTLGVVADSVYMYKDVKAVVIRKRVSTGS